MAKKETNEQDTKVDVDDDLPVNHDNVFEETELRVIGAGGESKIVEKKSDLTQTVNQQPEKCPTRARIQSANSPTSFMRQMLAHVEAHRKEHGVECPDCDRVIRQREEMMPGLIEAAQKSYRF